MIPSKAFISRGDTTLDKESSLRQTRARPPSSAVHSLSTSIFLFFEPLGAGDSESQCFFLHPIPSRCCPGRRLASTNTRFQTRLSRCPDLFHTPPGTPSYPPLQIFLDAAASARTSRSCHGPRAKVSRADYGLAARRFSVCRSPTPMSVLNVSKSSKTVSPCPPFYRPLKLINLPATVQWPARHRDSTFLLIPLTSNSDGWMTD